MSEPLVPAKTAIEQVRRADERWSCALRGLDPYPERLRALADAAELESRALTLADLANLPWTPRPGASNLKAPLEISPESPRLGPPASWKRFDQALKQLGAALEGESIKPIANAFAQISEALGEIAQSHTDDAAANTPGTDARQTG
jgi:hypothetical protein